MLHNHFWFCLFPNFLFFIAMNNQCNLWNTDLGMLHVVCYSLCKEGERNGKSFIISYTQVLKYIVMDIFKLLIKTALTSHLLTKKKKGKIIHLRPNRVANCTWLYIPTWKGVIKNRYLIHEKRKNWDIKRSYL